MVQYVKNQAGFGLLETVIALGVSALLFLGVMGMNNVMFKTQKTVQGEADWTTLQNSIQSILSSDSACAVAFRGTNLQATVALNGLPFPAGGYPRPAVPPASRAVVGQGETLIQGIYSGSLANPNPTALAEVGKPIGNSLQLTDLRFEPMGFVTGTASVLEPGQTVPTTYNQTTLNLYVKVAKTTGAGGAALAYGSATLDNFANMPVVSVLTDMATNQIVHCGQTAAGVCTSLQGTYDPMTGKCHLSKILPQTLANLHNFVNTLPGNCGDLVGATSTANSLFLLMSACNRYCAVGCNPTSFGCTGTIKSQGYTFGTVAECDDGPPPTVQCLCSY